MKPQFYSQACSVVPPVLILASVNAYVLWNEHWEHWKHMPPVEEQVEYPYQNIRNKNYFWGDGDKVSDFPMLYVNEMKLQLQLTDIYP